MELTLENVRKTFGEKVALDVDTYVIHDGEIVGLVGNNGAGKTTMFRVILDLIKPDEGVARIGGIATAHSEEWKAYTGAYVDTGFLIDYLTPEEYFDFVAKVNGVSKEDLDARLLQFEHFMNGEVIGNGTLIRNLSAGNKQKVGIISTMLSRPDLIILDEPFNFLDPSSQIIIKRLLKEYHDTTGATILISSHNLQHTIDISTRIALLEKGHIVKDLQNEAGSAEAELEQYFSVE